MLKKPSLRHTFTSAFSWLTGHHRESAMSKMKMAALAMLPSWDELANEQEDIRAEKLLEKVDQVCFCVKNCFLNEDLSTDKWAVPNVSIYADCRKCLM